MAWSYPPSQKKIFQVNAIWFEYITRVSCSRFTEDSGSSSNFYRLLSSCVSLVLDLHLKRDSKAKYGVQ